MKTPAIEITRNLAKTHLSRREAAAYISLAPATLARWAMTPGRAPKFTKLGTGKSSRVVYAIADLDAFLRGAKEAA